MAPTIHQRVAGYLWHWDTGPGWVRSPSAELKALRSDGMRVLKVQMQDDGPLPGPLVRMWRGLGFKVWGMVWPQGPPLSGSSTWGARETAEWFRAEKDRLVREGANLDGADFNFEQPVMQKDLESNGAWSMAFSNRFRELCPTLPAALDTYYGSAAGGVNLGAYVVPGKNFRLNVQTFWGPDGIYDDPAWRVVGWTSNAEPPIPKAQVKLITRVSPNNQGQLPDFAQVIDDMVRQGLKGLQLYYIDGGNVDQMRGIVRAAIQRGAAY